MKNVLITSAGKRVSLTRKFREELKAICDGGKVFTVDTNPQMAPACVLSDGCFKVPRCTSESYIQALLSICRDNNIGLIIPTIDTELAILSENKEDFDGWIRGIKEKFSDSLVLFNDIKQKKYGDEAFFRMPSKLRELSIDPDKYLIYLIVYENELEWMPGIQDSLR